MRYTIGRCEEKGCYHIMPIEGSDVSMRGVCRPKANQLARYLNSRAERATS